jgi:uncharacterized protein
VDALGPFELIAAAVALMAAYAVRGTAGFGGQTIAVPLLTLMMPITVVVPAVTVLTVVSSIVHWLQDWRKIAWREIARLMPFTLLGVLIGLYLFDRFEPRVLTRALGIFVMLYASSALMAASRPVAAPSRQLRPLGPALSAAAGAIGTVFGSGAGPLYVIYLNSLRLEKDCFRVTITTILTFQAVVRVAGYGHLGFYDWSALYLIAAGFPMMLIGARLGHYLAGRIEQRRFNLGVGALLMAIGAGLVFK